MHHKSKSSLNRDPILTDIEIDPLGTILLDMPMCQRLRRINQLGFTDLVFDGARHSRLSHMKGVYSRVLSLFEDIAKNHSRMNLPPPGDLLNEVWGNSAEERWRNCATVSAWAGMLHDVTHIPIGHTLEDEFSGIYVQHDSLLCPRHVNLWGDSFAPLPNTIKAILRNSKDFIPSNLPSRLREPLVLARFLHIIIMHKESRGIPFAEKVLAAIEKLKDDSDEIRELGQVQRKSQVEFLKALSADHKEFVHSRLYEPFMTDIITDTICADLLDYLQRDTYYTGLKASYDPRIVKSFVLVNEADSLRMAVAISSKNKSKRIDIVTDVLNLMKLRHDLALKVYYHKTKVIAGAMLVRAIGVLGDKPADGLQNDENSITHFTMTDEGLLFWIRRKALADVGSSDPLRQKNGAISQELIDAIFQRKLYKTLIALPFEGYWSKFDPEGREIAKLRSTHSELSEEIAAKSGCLPSEIILFIPPFKDKAKEVEARALSQDGSIVALGLHEDLRRDIDLLNENYQKLWHLYVFVHPSLHSDPERCSKITDKVKLVLAKRLPKGKVLGPRFTDHIQAQYLSLSARSRLQELSKFRREDSKEEKEVLSFVTSSDEWDQFVLEHELSGKDAFSILIYRRLLSEIGELEPRESQLFTGLREKTAVFERPPMPVKMRGKLALYSAIEAEVQIITNSLRVDNTNTKQPSKKPEK